MAEPWLQQDGGVTLREKYTERPVVAGGGVIWTVRRVENAGRPTVLINTPEPGRGRRADRSPKEHVPWLLSAVAGPEWVSRVPSPRSFTRPPHHHPFAVHVSSGPDARSVRDRRRGSSSPPSACPSSVTAYAGRRSDARRSRPRVGVVITSLIERIWFSTFESNTDHII